ncbi:MAG: M20 family metallo-hydrolase, partial [Deltaproteobacteria bacterium]|nr:M20 family metallo-hydrolase [Deltaproteobacteria bacterium]
MDKNLFEKISKRIESYKSEMVEMQKKLISIKAISPVSGGKGEFAKAKYLEPIIKNIFTEIEEYHCPRNDAEGGIRPNYIAKLKGKDSSRTMWVMAHMDIVPEGDIKLWNTDPFVATIKDGKIYGRGSEDNHQAIVSGIFVAKAFKEENVIPPINIGFLLVSDEENGSQYGVEHILKKNKNIFSKNDMVVAPDSGDSKGETIEIAEKSTIWLKVTSKGVQAHGSKPQKGVNAHRVGAHFIVKMGDFYKKYDHQNPLFEPSYSTF